MYLKYFPVGVSYAVTVELRLGAPVLGCLSRDLTSILAEKPRLLCSDSDCGQCDVTNVREDLESHNGRTRV
jgi:hypothetical protein